jgi:RNA polymerase sigma-70 factor (ECF subfamily)
VMFEIEGYSCDEIAVELGIPIGTVYSRLHAARRTISGALASAETGNQTSKHLDRNPKARRT